MAAMRREKIKRLVIKEKAGFELELERHEELSYVPPPSTPLYSEHPGPFSTHSHLSPRVSPPREEPALPEKKEESLPGAYVVSPMVGILYLAPSPEDSPFVKVGDAVDEGSVVCIIEAMKVMSEIKAGKRGVVAEICLDSGDPVEFGTKIFRIV